MGLIDRFTRDEVSAKVWWPFALLFVVLAVASFRLENRAIDERRAEASAWSVGVIREVLEPSLDSPEITRPLSEGDAAEATAALEPALSSDAVDAVRIWSSEGTLLYSSSEDDPVGSREALNDSELQATAAAPASSLSVISDRSTTGGQISPLFLTYATFAGAPSSIGEVQMTEAMLLADIDTKWLQIRLLLFGAALLVLTLAFLSMREPIAPIGTGVKFYPVSLPASLVVMERGEEETLRGSQIRRRSEPVDRRVAELEATTLALEGELQRALSSLAALRGSKGVTPRAIPPAAAPTPQVVHLPDASLAETEDTNAPPRGAGSASKAKAKAKASTRLRAIRTREPEPEPEPVVKAVRIGAAVEPQATTGSEPEVTTEPEPELTTPRLSIEPEASEPEASEPEASEPEPLLDLIVLPEIEPEPTPASVPATAATTQGDAVDVLNRLVAPVGPGHAQVDPSEIRARLARTAALKKPGSRERREEQERRAQGDDDPR